MSQVFPIPYTVDENGRIDGTAMDGITKRELFAAMAMQGVLARTSGPAANIAESCVEYADALIEELAK